MANRINLLERLSAVYDENQAQVLAEVFYSSYNVLVRREEFSEIKEIVRDLGETQQRKEQRVEELAEAQKRMEQGVAELGERQLRTESALQSLAREVGCLKEQLDGDLEDVAAIVIEDALHRELGWEVEELSRVWQTRDGVDEEIDAFGKAYDPSRPDSDLWRGEIQSDDAGPGPILQVGGACRLTSGR